MAYKNIKLMTYNLGAGAGLDKPKDPYAHLKNKIDVYTPGDEVIAFLQEAEDVANSDTAYGNTDVYTAIMKESKTFSMITNDNGSTGYKGVLTTLAPLQVGKITIGQSIVPDNTTLSNQGSSSYTNLRDSYVHKVNFDDKDVGIASVHLTSWYGYQKPCSDQNYQNNQAACGYVYQHASMKQLIDNATSLMNSEGLNNMILGGDFNTIHTNMDQYFSSSGRQHGVSQITKSGFSFTVTDGVYDSDSDVSDWIDYVVEITRNGHSKLTTGMSCSNVGAGGSDHPLVSCTLPGGTHAVKASGVLNNSTSSVYPLFGVQSQNVYLAMNDERLASPGDREWVKFIKYSSPSNTNPSSKCVQGLIREYSDGVSTGKFVYQTVCDYTDSNQAFLCVKTNGDNTGTGHWASLAGYEWIVAQGSNNVDCLWHEGSSSKNIWLDSGNTNDYLGYEGNLLNVGEERWAETDSFSNLNKVYIYD